MLSLRNIVIAPSAAIKRPKPSYIFRRCAIPNIDYVSPIRPISNNKLVYVSQTAPPLKDGDEWVYSDFINAIDENYIDSVIIKENDPKIQVITKDGINGFVTIPKDKDIKIVDMLVDHDVRVQFKENANLRAVQIAAMVLEYSITGILFIGILSMIITMIRNYSSNGRGGGMPPNGPFQMLQSVAKFEEKPDTGVTFADVAGLDNVKQELYEIVDFLKNPEKYSKLGAKIPKGCLLIGSPGCGKTLLSKAIAGEAGVPFFSCSASEFVEMFVGVGAARIRSLFAKAKAKAPCIIFIDEADAVMKARGGTGGISGNNDEREQTINQLLTEMDGFNENSGVIVIAATNRADVLDKALLRPGRFDRQIVVDLPDVNGRCDILRVHTREKPVANDVDLESIARITAGFSGADLQNLANEAAIHAARANNTSITRADFEQALEKIILGLERKRVLDPKKKWITAVHEAGHALAGLNVGDYDQVRKVTIIPRGMAGGVTYFEPDSDRVDGGMLSREYLENQLVVALGGRVAEELVFGKDEVTTGASGDLQQVYKIARRMVTSYGFSPKNHLHPIAWPDGNMFDTAYSQATAEQIDLDMKNIVAQAYKRCNIILLDNKDALLAVANALMNKETMTGDEIKTILDHYKIIY